MNNDKTQDKHDFSEALQNFRDWEEETACGGNLAEWLGVPGLGAVETALEMAQESGWRDDVENAPSGEWILIADHHGVGVWQVCWNANGYWQTDGNLRQHNPTHWMPLPKKPIQPPTDTQDKGEE